MSLRPTTRTEVRKKSYKTSVDGDEARRRRDDNLVEIRKNKREENLLRMRKVRPGLVPRQISFGGDASPVHDIQKKLERIPLLVQGLWSNDYSIQFNSITLLRMFLSKGGIPAMDKVIKAGAIPRFVEFLRRSNTPQLQSEAVLALAFFALRASEYRRIVIEHGAVPMFVLLLSSPNDRIREQAIWVLGNIAADSPTCRDLVLNHGALMPLLRQLNEHSNVSTLINGAWALYNLLYGKPTLPFEQVKSALQVLCQLLQLQNEEILIRVIAALNCLSEGSNDIIQVLLDAGVCPRIVKLLTHSSPKILSWALRMVGNIVGVNDRWTQIMIDNKVLPCLNQLLTQDHSKLIKMDVCWILSNIVAGAESQIQDVIDANIIPPLIHLLQNAEFDVKMEAAWAIRNATFKGSYDQIRYLVKQDCIKPLCDLLSCSDTSVVTLCLEGLESILELGKIDKEKGLYNGINVYAQMIAECEGFEKILILQVHDNDEISDISVEIVEEYWPEEIDIEILPDANIQEHNLPPGRFTFG